VFKRRDGGSRRAGCAEFDSGSRRIFKWQLDHAELGGTQLSQCNGDSAGQRDDLQRNDRWHRSGLHLQRRRNQCALGIVHVHDHGRVSGVRCCRRHRHADALTVPMATQALAFSY